MTKKKIAVVGLGMIGGSLALALREAFGDAIELCAIDLDADMLSTAANMQMVDWTTLSIEEGAAWAEIIFLCTPVLQIPQIVSALAPHLKEGAILSDVGSTKKVIAEQIKASLPAHAEYVAGHPMAGRESSGLLAADKDLFREKSYIFLPEYTKDVQALKTIERLIDGTGAKITHMSADAHDRCAAVISHVPHVAAAALVNLLEGVDAESVKLAGGGFKDTTRIASSNADMWSDICMTNGPEISETLEDLKKLLDDVIHAIKQQDRTELHGFFSRAKERRDRLISGSHVTN